MAHRAAMSLHRRGCKARDRRGRGNPRPFSCTARRTRCAQLALALHPSGRIHLVRGGNDGRDVRHRLAVYVYGMMEEFALGIGIPFQHSGRLRRWRGNSLYNSTGEYALAHGFTHHLSHRLDGVIHVTVAQRGVNK